MKNNNDFFSKVGSSWDAFIKNTFIDTIKIIRFKSEFYSSYKSYKRDSNINIFLYKPKKFSFENETLNWFVIRVPQIIGQGQGGLKIKDKSKSLSYSNIKKLLNITKNENKPIQYNYLISPTTYCIYNT